MRNREEGRKVSENSQRESEGGGRCERGMETKITEEEKKRREEEMEVNKRPKILSLPILW